MAARTLAMILAGGKGSRLAPLTCHRAKPAVPFGGRYRIIDFVLSNFVNSGYHHIYVLTQYMASSLITHLNRTWHMARLDEFIEVVPAQMRRGEHWYLGTADSVLQNLNLIHDAHAEHVAVFGGDHIYKFAINDMERQHREREADLTVAAFPVPIGEAHQFGVIQIDEHGRIMGFEEKPRDPVPMPGRPGWCLVSMGNYFFKRDVIESVLLADANDPTSTHDFGRDCIPAMVRDGRQVFIYDFSKNRIPGEPEAEPYWRDVGSLDSYFEANMELRSAVPPFNLYNRGWPILTGQPNHPPARFVYDGAAARAAELVDSLVSEGTILNGAALRNVVAAYDCYFHAGSQVEDSVVLSGCDLGAGCQLRKVLLDKNCSVAPGTAIGFDLEDDRRRFPFRTESGLVVLPKGTHVPRTGPIELSYDVAALLRADKATAGLMQEFADAYTTSSRSRHSHDSVGPRFRRYGRSGSAS